MKTFRMKASKLSLHELDLHAEKLQRDGYTIITEVISEPDIEEKKRAIDETLETE